MAGPFQSRALQMQLLQLQVNDLSYTYVPTLSRFMTFEGKSLFVKNSDVREDRDGDSILSFWRGPNPTEMYNTCFFSVLTYIGLHDTAQKAQLA